VRDTSSWRIELLEDLRQASFPEGMMPAEAFCAVELGLHFMTSHFRLFSPIRGCREALM
jgi:hypothetical protein